MADTTQHLEALYAAPSADIGPTSPRAELLTAAELLRRQNGYFTGQLCLWLADTALLHNPDETGRHCERDADTWPCHDVQAAQKVALAIRLAAPEATDA